MANEIAANEIAAKEALMEAVAWAVVTTSIGVPNHFLPEIVNTRAPFKHVIDHVFLSKYVHVFVPKQTDLQCFSKQLKNPPFGKKRKRGPNPRRVSVSF